MLSSILTVASEMFGGEAWIIGIYGMGITLVALIGGVILYRITGKRSDPHADLARELSYTYVGETVGGENEETENPAMADSMPQSKPETIAFLAKKPQNRRLYLMATVFENEGHTADFTTKRRIPRKGRVEQYRSEDCSVLVNQSGNRHWVRP